MNLQAALATALLAAGMVGQANAATATFTVSNPYAQFADSPFAAFAAGNPNFVLEDFEHGSLTSGVLASAGVIASPDPATDSVDGDDGVLDGNGNAGHSWYLGGTSSVSFSFNAAVLGALPTHVGFVWTDIGLPGPGGSFGIDSILVRVFDADGHSLGFTGADDLGDGSIAGGTAEDTFFGAVFAGGIARIQIVSLGGSQDWEIDHLQFGTAAPVPVPAAAWMLAPSLVALVGLRRRRA